MYVTLLTWAPKATINKFSPQNTKRKKADSLAWDNLAVRGRDVHFILAEKDLDKQDWERVQAQPSTTWGAGTPTLPHSGKEPKLQDKEVCFHFVFSY